MSEPSAQIWWKSPGETTVHRLVPKPDGGTGFRFEPFRQSSLSPSVLIQGEPEESSYPVPGTIELTEATPPKTVSESEHVQAVREAVKAIDSGAFDKTVLSRSEFWATDRTPESVFRAKCEAYPDAFVYLFDHPVAGVWIGATPEVLLRQSSDQFETVALAGTKSDSSRQWTEKERHEQALVADYIEQKLRAHAASDLDIAPPESIGYGPLEHLRSNVAFSSQHPCAFWLDVLHPTPAVGGVPKAAALEFIAAHEQGERRYYTGYLGLIRGNEAEFYVNLRCMQCFAGGYQLFAGGGIVKGSDPQNEWRETQDKIDSIRTGLGDR